MRKLLIAAALCACGTIAHAQSVAQWRLTTDTPPLLQVRDRSAQWATVGELPGAGALELNITEALASPPPIGSVTPNTVFAITPLATDNSTAVGTTAWYRNLKQVRTLQSFGAKGDGVTDDTVAVTTALNSGVPLYCNGTFILAGLITITDKSVDLQGAGLGITTSGSCKLFYTTDQTMIHFSASSANFALHVSDVLLSPRVAIETVAGPEKTAAIFVDYPNGTSSSNRELVTLRNIAIIPGSAGNYIKNGIAFKNATGVLVDHVWYVGQSPTFNATLTGFLVYGQLLPFEYKFLYTLEQNVGVGISLDGGAAVGFQGVTITNNNCEFCDTAIKAIGTDDGTSNTLHITNADAYSRTNGVLVQNVSGVRITGGYQLLGPVGGLGPPATAACFLYTWTMAPPAYVSASIEGNTCDAGQSTSATRIGTRISGFSNNNINTYVGPNVLSRMTDGVSVVSGSNGVTVAKQQMSSVTTELTNAAAVGNVTTLPLVNGLTANQKYTIAQLLAITCGASTKTSTAWVEDTVGLIAPAFHGNVAGGGVAAVSSLASCDGTNWVYN